MKNKINLVLKANETHKMTIQKLEGSMKDKMKKLQNAYNDVWTSAFEISAATASSKMKALETKHKKAEANYNRIAKALDKTNRLKKVS